MRGAATHAWLRQRDRRCKCAVPFRVSSAQICVGLHYVAPRVIVDGRRAHLNKYSTAAGGHFILISSRGTQGLLRE